MLADRPPPGLNDNHKRVLLSAMVHLDKLLGDIDAIASGTDSPFSAHLDDLTPSQRQVVRDYVRRIRSSLVGALARFGVPLPPRQKHASWSIRTTLNFLDIDLHDVGPEQLRGYGELGKDAADDVADVQGELRALTNRLARYLDQGLGGDLARRLKRLEATHPSAQLAKTLERMMTRHGLVELRPTLTAVLAAMESSTLEIGVFGRVSCGKSSLLNAILETTILPVGVTPVTAVPTRITRGDRLRATVVPDEGEPHEIDAADAARCITDFKKESESLVRYISIELPCDALRPGIAFIDTPGVASLSAASTRAANAWLPICDLGVVLVDAGGTLAAEDLHLIRDLYDSGVEAMVVLTKADLLADEDRASQQQFLEHEIESHLGLRVPVEAVSTRPPHDALARTWFRESMSAYLDSANEMCERSVRRKLGHLKEAVIASLRTRLAAHPDDGSNTARRARVVKHLSDARRLVDASLVHTEAIAEKARQLVPEAVRLSVKRRAEHRSESAELLRTDLAGLVEPVRDELRAELLATRNELRGIASMLAQDPANRCSPNLDEIRVDVLSLPELRLPEALIEELGPCMHRQALESLWMRFSGRMLRERIAIPTGTVLSHFSAELRDWARTCFDRLTQQFEAQCDSAALASQEGSAAGQDATELERDLSELGAAGHDRPGKGNTP